MGFKPLRPASYAVILVCLVLAASFASRGEAASRASSGDPFDKLKGNWKGGGSVILNDGTVKKVTCSSQYKVAGDNVTQTLNCKGNDYEVNTTLKVTDKDGKIKGSWNESVYAASGSVSGTAKGDLVHAVIAGDKFSGRMSINVSDSGHEINIMQLNDSSGTYRPVASVSLHR